MACTAGSSSSKPGPWPPRTLPPPRARCQRDRRLAARAVGRLVVSTCDRSSSWRSWDGPVRVCLVSQEYPPQTFPGGIGTQTWNKARSLARLGHTVHVLCCAGVPGPGVRVEMDGAVTVHRIEFPQVEAGEELVVADQGVYWLGYSWTVLRELQRLFQSISFDLV